MSEAVVNNTKDFIIENGVLVKYIGNDTIVRIPDGVKEIDKEAFVKTQVEELIVPGNLSPQQLSLPSIRRITFLEGTTIIPMSIFNDNIELIKIPNTVKYFGFGSIFHIQRESSSILESVITPKKYNPNLCFVYDTIPYNAFYFELENGMVKNYGNPVLAGSVISGIKDTIDTVMIDNGDYKEILSKVLRTKTKKYLPRVNYDYMRDNINRFKELGLTNDDIVKIYCDNDNLLTARIEFMYQNFQYLLDQRLVPVSMLKRLYFESDDISLESVIKKYREVGKISELLNTLFVEPNSHNQLELRDRLLSAATLNLLSDDADNKKLSTAYRILNRDNFKTIVEADDMRFSNILVHENSYHCFLSRSRFEAVRYPIYEKVNGYSKTMFNKLNTVSNEALDRYINSLNVIKEWDDYSDKVERANVLKNEFCGKMLLGIILKMFNDQNLKADDKIRLNELLETCKEKIENNKSIGSELTDLQSLLANYINRFNIEDVLYCSTVSIDDMEKNRYGDVAVKLMLKVDPYSFEALKSHNGKPLNDLEKKYAIDAKKSGYLFSEDVEERYKKQGIILGNISNKIINYIEFINNQISLPKIPKEEKDKYINSVRGIVKRYVETASEEELFKLYRAIDLFLRTENEYLVQKNGTEELAKQIFDLDDDRFDNSDRMLYCMYNLNRLAHDTADISIKGDVINNYRIDLDLRSNTNNQFMRMLKSSNTLSKYNLSLDEVFNLIDTRSFIRLFDDTVSEQEKIGIIDNSRLRDTNTKEDDLESIISALKEFKDISKQSNSDSNNNISEIREKLKYISNQYILFFETKNILQEEMIKRFEKIEQEINHYNIYALDTIDKKREFYRKNGFIMEFQEDGQGNLLLVVYSSKFDEPFSLHLKNVSDEIVDKISSSGCLKCPTLSYCRLEPPGLTSGNTYTFKDDEFVDTPGFSKINDSKSCLLYNYMTYDLPIIKSKEQFESRFKLTKRQKQSLKIDDSMFDSRDKSQTISEMMNGNTDYDEEQAGIGGSKK